MELIVDTYGTKLNIKNKLLVVEAPEDEPAYIPTHELDRLVIHKGLRLTSNVLFYLMKKNVDIVMMSRYGNVKGRVWNNRFGSIADIREKQLALKNSAIATNYIIKLLIYKFKGHHKILNHLRKQNNELSDSFHQVQRRIQDCESELKNHKDVTTDEVVQQLRSIEARAAKLYWKAVALVIPGDYKFPGRRARGPQDPMNSMLNYAYGILYRNIESALLKVGIDPAIGWYHVNQHNRPSLVYDVIETMRHWAEDVVIRLCYENVLPPSLIEFKNGKYLLSKTARRILALSVNDYLDNTIRYQDKQHKRSYVIHLEAQKLAGLLKNANVETYEQ